MTWERLGDVAVVALIVLFAWLGVQVHNSIAGLADMARGIQATGTSIQRAGVNAGGEIRRSVSGAADAAEAVPFVGGRIGSALRDTASSTSASIEREARTTGAQLPGVGSRGGAPGARDGPAGRLAVVPHPDRRAARRRGAAVDAAVAGTRGRADGSGGAFRAGSELVGRRRRQRQRRRRGRLRPRRTRSGRDGRTAVGFVRVRAGWRHGERHGPHAGAVRARSARRGDGSDGAAGGLSGGGVVLVRSGPTRRCGRIRAAGQVLLVNPRSHLSPAQADRRRRPSPSSRPSRSSARLDFTDQREGRDRVRVAAQFCLGRRLAGEEAIGDGLLRPLGQAGVVDEPWVEITTRHPRDDRPVSGVPSASSTDRRGRARCTAPRERSTRMPPQA